MTSQKAKKLKADLLYDYSTITSIDGTHPWQEAVPMGHIKYRVRQKKGGKIAYFNFSLAKEMGLIPRSHPEELNDSLRGVLLETFSLVIINEYDLINKVPIKDDEIKPHHYMATRYLQLQHASRKGYTSGDGRSIWNGHFKKGATTWDVSSCGTGATCLSPASSKHNKFYQTGDPSISYGCGHSDLLDGMSAAILSEIMHAKGIATERTLVVIEYPKGLSINVRAHKNLLRPSHFFNHLKQDKKERLECALNFYIDREVANKTWVDVPLGRADRYSYFLDKMVDVFAKTVARFENDYIFCWLDWDGDNILMDGGIIDYGSIRQFGLFHHEYRYDDDERWSTNILEQKNKAKYIVQTFLQAIDYVLQGKKTNIKHFNNHPKLKKFEKRFQFYKDLFLAEQMGFKEEEAIWLVTKKQKSFRDFTRVYRAFERELSPVGIKKVPDGINADAVFCMRDILFSLPEKILLQEEFFKAEDFMEIIGSKYARPENLKLTPSKKRKIKDFQSHYEKLLSFVDKNFWKHSVFCKRKFAKQAQQNNVYERITGDAVIHITNEILRARKRMDSYEFYQFINLFIESYIENKSSDNKLMKKLQNIIFELSEGL